MSKDKYVSLVLLNVSLFGSIIFPNTSFYNWMLGGVSNKHLPKEGSQFSGEEGS
jgi:hypothetical protein